MNETLVGKFDQVWVYKCFLTEPHVLDTGISLYHDTSNINPSFCQHRHHIIHIVISQPSSRLVAPSCMSPRKRRGTLAGGSVQGTSIFGLKKKTRFPVELPLNGPKPDQSIDVFLDGKHVRLAKCDAVF